MTVITDQQTRVSDDGASEYKANRCLRERVSIGERESRSGRLAEKRIAAICAQIAECTAQLEQHLSRSTATISVRDGIDLPLEQITFELIDDVAISEAGKDELLTQLGVFQEWVKRGLKEHITPLQANRIRLLVGGAQETAEKHGAEQLRPAYRAVYEALQSAIHTAVPGAKDLEEKLTELQAAKSRLEAEVAAKELHGVCVCSVIPCLIA